MERIISEKPLDLNGGDGSGTDRYDNFGRLQESLYKKFDYFNLNKLRLPVKTEYSENLTDASGIKTGYREMQSAASQADISAKTQTEIDSPPGQNTWGTYRSGGTSRRKKSEVKKFTVKGQTWRQTPTTEWKLVDRTKYSEDATLDSKASEIQLDEEEERKYIEMLNRNIKTKRPITASNIAGSTAQNKNSQGYIDINGFFQNQVDARIEQGKDMKEKPQDFSR